MFCLDEGSPLDALFVFAAFVLVFALGLGLGLLVRGASICCTSPVVEPADLRFARARPYLPAMSDLEFWAKKLREAERELNAATTRTALNAAAKRLMLAKEQLKRLATRGRASRGRVVNSTPS